MGKKRRQLLENPHGRGRIYKDGKSIAVVNYSLQVNQEIIIFETLSGTEEIPGRESITGQITVIEGERNLTDGNLILHLSDGREWEFFAKSGSPMTAVYSAINASGEGLKKVN